MVKTMKRGPYVLTFLGDGPSRDVVYCPLSLEQGERVWPLLPAPRPVLGLIDGVDWNRELSPWPAPGAFGKGEDFAGEGAAFLRQLTGELLPRGEALLGFEPRRRGLAGYSLGGLFALWSSFLTDAFPLVASVSGSLWFDGFVPLLERTPLPHPPRKVVLSLGQREKRTRNPRLAGVEDATRAAARLLMEQGIPVELEFYPGGHFQDVPQRLAGGISRMLAETLTVPPFSGAAPSPAAEEQRN